MPKKDIGLGVVSIGFGIWVLTVANELKKKAAFWPKIVAWGIIILGAIILLTGIYHLVQERKASGKQSSQVKAETKAELIKYAKVGGIILLLVAFYFLFQYVYVFLKVFQN